MTKRKWYQPRWAAVWFGRDGKIRHKSFVDYSKAKREADRHDHSSVLYHETKVEK